MAFPRQVDAESSNLTPSSGPSADAPPLSKAAANRKHHSIAEHGNYHNYYFHRTPVIPDARLSLLDPALFLGQRVLDLGCNAGKLTVEVVTYLGATSSHGIDIDPILISRATQLALDAQIPTCTFSEADFMTSSSTFFASSSLSGSPSEKPFDCILLLSITKWLHLHHGDAGLRNLFSALHSYLEKNGGTLVVEPQEWENYVKAANKNKALKPMFRTLKMRPNFEQELVEAGFSLEKIIEREEGGFTSSLGFVSHFLALFWSGTNHSVSKSTTMAVFTLQAPILILAALLAAAFCGRHLTNLLSRFQRNVAILQDYPGLRLFFHPHTVFGLLPRIPYINCGDQYTWRERNALFSDRNTSDVISLVSVFPPARAFHLADPLAIKTVLADRQRYTKPTHLYRALGHYGMNLAVGEGEVFRRHKKIVTGSFTEKTNEFAWIEAARVVEELLGEWDHNLAKGVDGHLEVKVPDFLRLTLKAGLFIILATSFSARPPWDDNEPSALPAGHRLSFREVMHGVVTGSMVKVMAPEWSYKLPIQRLRHVDECYREFGLYIRESIAERRKLASDPRESEAGRKDLLGALLYASNLEKDEDGDGVGDNTDEKKRATLSDDELMGNMYLFLVAGHETTANTLAFVFTLLALYPEEQERLFQHVTDVLPPDAEPSFADFNKLTRVHAVFNETLRLFPAAVVIPKFAVQDTVIPTSPLEDGTPGSNVFVPKWTEIYINNVALGRNQKYWGEDADVFRPDRFIDAPDGSYRWPRDAFLGFSAGQRACIGQKFATVTSTAIISLILRNYSVHLPEDLDGTGAQRAAKGETFQQKVERVTKCSSFIALTMKTSPLVFRKREP
ncbi:7SK snRNA methylphosphate capping enzyme, partial [Phenoliferia sp. Uapishka_3]